MWLKGEALVAVMPLTVSEKGIANSPYGASFGGIVTNKKLSLKTSEEITCALMDYMHREGINGCNLTFGGSYTHNSPSDNLEFSLLKAGFKLQRADLFSVVALGNTFDDTIKGYEGRARTTIKKVMNNFTVEHRASLSEFWDILNQDKTRHNSSPTHSREELVLLGNQFPDLIWCDIAVHKNGAKVGICYFALNSQVLMTFYMSQEDQALRLDGTNVLVDFGMEKAIEKGFKYFDFGGSTIGFEIQNIGVSQFKESFGAKGRLRKRFEWNNG